MTQSMNATLRESGSSSGTTNIILHHLLGQPAAVLREHASPARMTMGAKRHHQTGCERHVSKPSAIGCGDLPPSTDR
jgi:hypothetical protein